MKYLVTFILLFCATAVFAASNCNHSQFTVINKRDEAFNLAIHQGTVYVYATDGGWGFENEGRLRNIVNNQPIPARSSITAYAFATNSSNGDITEYLQLVGEQGEIAVKVNFSSFLWGFGSCTPRVTVNSDEYHSLSIDYIKGTPAQATLTIS